MLLSGKTVWKLKDYSSSLLTVLNGVPQGSTLGVLLFSAFINDKEWTYKEMLNVKEMILLYIPVLLS